MPPRRVDQNLHEASGHARPFELFLRSDCGNDDRKDFLFFISITVANEYNDYSYL